MGEILRPFFVLKRTKIRTKIRYLEKNIRKICKAMGISASEIMESEEEVKRNLRAGEIPVMHKYRKLDESDQCPVQGYMDALLEKQDGEKSTS